MLLQRSALTLWIFARISLRLPPRKNGLCTTLRGLQEADDLATDKKYQQQQEQLAAKQTQDHQKLQQQQEKEHQQATAKNYNDAQKQKMEQRHAQQTQQVEQKHAH